MRADERASTFPRLGARRSARVEFGGPSDKIVSLVRGHGERLRDSEPSAPEHRCVAALEHHQGCRTASKQRPDALSLSSYERTEVGHAPKNAQWQDSPRSGHGC